MTSLQQLYEELEYVEKNSHNGLVSIIDLKRAIGNYYLEKEKQQIIKARLSLDQSIHFEDALDNAEQYYEQTYNQPKK